MAEIKDVLLRMVSAARRAKHLDDELVKIGYSETPYADIYADISDAIYKLIGEHCETFETSITHTMLTAPFMDDERRAASLAYTYNENNSIPKPDTIEPNEMKDMHNKNGGYMSPEGDWK